MSLTVTGHIADFSAIPSQKDRTCRWPEYDNFGNRKPCGQPAVLTFSMIENESGAGLVAAYCRRHVLVAIGTVALQLSSQEPDR